MGKPGMVWSMFIGVASFEIVVEEKGEEAGVQRVSL
jgi:hypothetical protein